VRQITRLLNDARFWRLFALINIFVYIILWVIAEIFGWVNDSAFISRLSILALILSSLSWWQSGRVEVKQQDDADVSEVLEEVKNAKSSESGA
jgi:hypothetical protein